MHFQQKTYIIVNFFLALKIILLPFVLYFQVSLTEKRNAFDWEHFEFDPVLASSVNISVQSAYEYLPNLYNGKLHDIQTLSF